MQIISKIAVDLASPGITPRIYGKQDDSGSRWVEIALYNSGVAFDVPDNAVLAVRYTGPTGAKGLYDWDITHDSNVVLCPLVDQIFAAAGRVTAELRIVDSQSSVTTWAFYVDVEGSKSADATLPPDYINQFTQIASQVAADADRAEAAADSIDTTQLLHYEDYDPAGDVKAAGGIAEYVAGVNNRTQTLSRNISTSGLTVDLSMIRSGNIVAIRVHATGTPTYVAGSASIKDYFPLPSPVLNGAEFLFRHSPSDNACFYAKLDGDYIRVRWAEANTKIAYTVDGAFSYSTEPEG